MAINGRIPEEAAKMYRIFFEPERSLERHCARNGDRTLKRNGRRRSQSRINKKNKGRIRKRNP
jgi:hypothetical protein